MARIARNGIAILGVFVMGAGWSQFYPVDHLASLSMGVLVALVGIFAAAK